MKIHTFKIFKDKESFQTDVSHEKTIVLENIIAHVTFPMLWLFPPIVDES